MISGDISEQKILPWLTGAKFFLIVMALLSVFATSCDESSVVGIDVQPANDMLDVNLIDTVTLITKTIKMDSLQTDGKHLRSFSITGALLGTYIDPVFGRSNASIYTQLNLNTNNPGFGVNPILDSAVLSLVYDSSYCYGNSVRAHQTISVYKVFEHMDKEKKYYSSNSLSTSTFDLANGYVFIPDPTKSVTVFGEVLKPQLRIKLIQLGQGILNNPGNLADNNAFQNFMRGLYITTENTTGLNSGEGNILRFNLEDSQSKLTLYYHNDTDDSLKYDFSTNGAARFSRFTHDYTSVDADLASQLSGGSQSQNDVVFVQSMSGTKVKIEMPYILNWGNEHGTSGINKAELVIKINTNTNYELGTFAAPEKLIVYGINDDGSEYALPDLFETRPSYFGGVYNSTAQEYRINISRYIQQLLLGERKNNGLHLLALNGAIHANRLVIGGGGNGSAYQMKLNITSTKVP